ncbi:adenosylcobyric acid synthase (glutamine-hydrolysing) [Rhodoblastus acidophilus]|uniref:Cobyric acid synthase n=1 Tax=Rhodoblastus acidophilus TaxID=1074 RepID=A0A212S665_RHOAC|nr:cobyric acid synthase [Rhodoblastus acidophilus]PPQ37454.1 cobyric acid synthase [Rhodoblastus acidophilus]RAI18842.1 cobyric acid synthase CobQ [Rhodoblastus acidophilus]SNB80732.1 adenosylcobyric acid synthase (glutamine-hydrolysing) [Rhodoblastus acidophilus]
MTRVLMFQGTGSDVGKSLLVAGFCRAFARRGLRVAPFKPQNMSNNAAVTADGGEIGRAQALQARACGLAPSVHMNPVLLKPQSAVGSQIVVQGRIFGQAQAADYQARKAQLAGFVAESFRILGEGRDLLLVEGAGSPAEVNLRANDIANMGFARAHNVPVVLIGDIDRGGVIAQIVGTKAVLDAEDSALIQGFLVNKFRGDPRLFDAGMAIIADKTGWAPLGLISYFHRAARLPAEDAFSLRGARQGEGHGKRIVVPLLPHIANFDDFDPLKAESGVELTMAPPGEPLPVCDLVILPGSKTTIADLAFFRAQGWDVDLFAHARRGGKIFGICGGYQMLGQTIADPLGMEGPAGAAPGLGLLAVETELAADKTLAACAGVSTGGAAFSGYEMHVGVTRGADCARPLLRFADGRAEGASNAAGTVRAAYVHGLFAADAFRAEFLDWIGADSAGLNYEAEIERILDELADHLAAHVDLDALLALAR